MIAHARLARVLAAAAALGLTGTLTACGSSGSAGAGSTGGPIEVEVSQLFVTVTNQSGRALTNLKVEIVPVGRATIFTATQYRLESGSKKDFALADLRGSDGTPFNLRVHKPKTIRVTATDIDETPYEVEVPWG